MPASADLLKELRIDRSAPPPAPSSRKRLALAAVGVGVLAVAIGAWVAFGREQALAVQTADVVALGNGGSASATVLDATGYVVARRMATVSAKITGKVREVLIEEGQHVEAGQILATLDPVDADAERELASSQVSAAQREGDALQRVHAAVGLACLVEARERAVATAGHVGPPCGCGGDAAPAPRRRSVASFMAFA